MDIARRYLADLCSALDGLDVAVIERVAHELVRAFAQGNIVFCLGNGGSAATASHLAADLTKLTAVPGDGPRLKVMSLCEHVSALSAIANDMAYEEVFVEQLRTFLAPGDVVVGFSTSGSSPNVVRALEYAASRGATTVAVTGRRGAPLRQVAETCLTIDSDTVQQIEDASMVAAHLMCLLARAGCDSLRSARVLAAGA
jgi:D-sedoheptulose 7-phosphate isomerase